MQTGFEIMDYDKNLKELWLRRTAAGFVDFLITSTIATILIYFLRPMDFLDYFFIFLLQGPIWFVYSVIFDMISGKTLGKYLFRIKSVAFIGNLSWTQAILRNLTKLNVLLAIADTITGLSTEGDPRQRYIERFIDSLVISEKRVKRMRRFVPPVEDKEDLVLP